MNIFLANKHYVLKGLTDEPRQSRVAAAGQKHKVNNISKLTLHLTLNLFVIYCNLETMLRD